MKKLGLAAIAAISAALAAGQASAAKVIDFVAEAAGNERGVADGTILNTAALGNLNLSFRGGIGAAARDFAYFNDATSPAMSGLGTCTRLDAASQCTPFYDASVSSMEWVQVTFEDGPFAARKLSFRGTGNVSIDGDMVGLVKITTSLNSIISSVILTFAEAASKNFQFVDWIRFEFVDTEFTVASISNIPVPGALPLLLSGLAGLGFAARRKRKA